MGRLLTAAFALAFWALAAHPAQWSSGKIIRVENQGTAYDYSIFDRGCGYVGRSNKELRLKVGDEVKFSITGKHLRIVDSTGKVQRTQYRLQWLAPPPPPPPVMEGMSRSAAPVSGETVDRQVAVAIEKMLDPKAEHAAFADLEVFGCTAVPAIIRQMDDWRNLPDPSIALRNKSSDAFEASRIYAPAKVVDALAAILNQITGRSFGFIYNGGTDAERANTVSGWRDFLRQTPESELCNGRQ